MPHAAANVDTVLVAGRVVKRDGRLLCGGLEEKQARLVQSSRRILSQAGLYD